MRTLIIYLSLLSIVFTSCQDVIDLNLDSTTPVIVIQGNIYNTSGPYTIKISQTVDFDASNVYPAVSGATVIISDNHGTVDTLAEQDSGTYVTSKITGIEGYTYSLTVVINGETYSATSTMPNVVPIDSIYTEDAVIGTGKQVTVKFSDPADITNYYKFILFNNGTMDTDYSVMNDELVSGETFEYSFILSKDDGYNSGDLITIWLESIDKGVYDYFRTEGNSGSQSTSPANPISNISNGALGYFNACSYSSASINIP